MTTSASATKIPPGATHRFLAHLPGYQGWQWAVVVASYPGADHATVSEVVLVPGPESLLAPQWVPWDQRVRPGDLSPGDLLAPLADDLRLVPGYMSSGDPQVDETAAEIGLGRRTVMSAWGRAEAAQRWHDGDHGPRAQMAQSTKRVCRDCGFLLPLAGSLGAMFGVCGNEMSADGSMSSTSNTAAARIPTLPLPRVAVRRCTTPTTTACSTSARPAGGPRAEAAEPARPGSRERWTPEPSEPVDAAEPSRARRS